MIARLSSFTIASVVPVLAVVPLPVAFTVMFIALVVFLTVPGVRIASVMIVLTTISILARGHSIMWWRRKDLAFGVAG